MRKRWIGACAIGHALLIGAASWAQTPEGQRVPHPSPAVEAQTHGEAQHGHRLPEPTPVPIRIIQSPGEAAHDAAREAKSDEHEAKDLAAQEKAAQAANLAAAAADWQVIAAFIGAALTFIGTGLLVWTLWETRKANRIARDAYIADQRPWVSVEVEISSPLQWHGLGCAIPLEFLVENSGRSPALNVFAFVRTVEKRGIGPDLVKAQLTFADEMRSAKHRLGFSLFPGQSRPIPIIEMFIAGHDDSDETPLHGVQGEEFSLAFIGCISYDSEISDASSVHQNGLVRVNHQTGFICHIIYRSPENGQIVPLPVIGVVEAECLELVRWGQDGRVD